MNSRIWFFPRRIPGSLLESSFVVLHRSCSKFQMNWYRMSRHAVRWWGTAIDGNQTKNAMRIKATTQNFWNPKEAKFFSSFGYIYIKLKIRFDFQFGRETWNRKRTTLTHQQESLMGWTKCTSVTKIENISAQLFDSIKTTTNIYIYTLLGVFRQQQRTRSFQVQHTKQI